MMAFLLMLFSLSFSAFAQESDNVMSLSPPKNLPAFILKTAENKKFDIKQLQTHYSILFFGFTRCQMVCPTTMMVLKQAYTRLEKDKKILPQVIFVSIDTEGDTPQKADNYAKSFDPHFMGVAGKSDQITALTRSLGVLYMKVKQGSMDTIDHSANLFLINPEGRVQAIFSPPYEANTLAKEISKAVKMQ
ncbi:MAG: SCO family protein [Gammaproteobacteria bacterium]|nr:SCO family protein [Gammaproteobacteria bacterium]